MASIQKEQIALLKAFIESCKKDPSILHLPELVSYKEYIDSLGGTVPEIKSKHEAPTFDSKPKMASIQKEQVALLRVFIEACKKDPSILHLPALAFYKEYIESLGGTIPKINIKPQEPKVDPKPKEEPTPKRPPSPVKKTSPSADADSDKDLPFKTGPETEAVPELPDKNKQPTEEESEKAAEKRSQAISAMGKGDDETALAAFSESIRLNPANAISYRKRAQLFVKLKRPNAAIQDCNRALEINPDSVVPYQQRGKAYRLLGDVEKAYKDFAEAQKIEYDDEIQELLKSLEKHRKPVYKRPPSPVIKTSPEAEAESDVDIDIDLHFKTGPEAEAVPELPDKDKQPTEEESDKANERRYEAISAMGEGDDETALAAFSESIRLNPANAVSYRKRAQLFVKLKRPNAAIQDCNRALEINPDSVVPYQQRGKAYRLLGDVEKAYKDFAEAQKIEYDDEIQELLKSLEKDVHKVQEHNRKKREKEEEKIRRESAKSQRQPKKKGADGDSPSFNIEDFAGLASGLPNFTGDLPEGFPPIDPESGELPPEVDTILEDTRIRDCFEDEEVSSAFADISQNPGNITKYMNNPKMKKVSGYLKEAFAKAKVIREAKGSTSSSAAKPKPATASDDLGLD